MPAEKPKASSFGDAIDHEAELVASLAPYVPFAFPGDGMPPAAAKTIPALLDSIQFYAEAIGRKRFEGISEAYVGILAEKLVQWLEARAGEGSDSAQAAIVGTARTATKAHWWSLMQGHETTLKAAQRAADIPGWVSLNPELSASTRHKLEEIGQGSKTPVPMTRPEKAKKSSRDVTLGKHRLVANLWEYVMNYRRHCAIQVFEIPLDHPSLNVRIREMLALPDLIDEPKVITAWHKVGLKIVKDWTDGKPENHPDFNRPPLDEMNRPLAKSSIAQDLNSAWKQLARKKSMIESGI